jgi:predicted RNA-binding Zn-ribbon protein involved in translation (DUF1610 family)
VIVRCGRCRTQFQVPGAGRYACPSCGTGNEVRVESGPADGPAAAGAGGEGIAGVPPAPSPPSTPSPRTECGSCGFSFIVGDIEVARCPNCGAEVALGYQRGGH